MLEASASPKPNCSYTAEIMFIGHFAIGFAAKRFAPRTSAALLMAAPQLSDILWPIFLLLGVEQVRIDPGNTRFTPFDFVSYPWSHSLLLVSLWASLFAGAYQVFARYRRGTLAIWIGVMSHWVLDWISHRPDMPLYPGSHRFGLGLWNSIAGTMIVEIAMFVTGVCLYASATQARDRIGKYSFASYIVVLLALYVGNLLTGPPANLTGLAWTGVVATVVLITWAWWFDNHRIAKIARHPETHALSA